MFNHLRESSAYVATAGKITLATALGAVAVFSFAFLFNAGKTEIQRVSAQTASTTLFVLNTPPQWTVDAYEEFESSTTSPTNSGAEVSWLATGTDANDQPYFLLICSTATAPNAGQAVDYDNLGTAPPSCADGVQWAVSASTTSGQQARAATTTTEVGAFAGEILDWYAWICDDDPVLPRCNSGFRQGLNATNSSPFVVNFRPVFTTFYNDSPVEPDGLLTFYSTSSDPSTFKPGDDDIFLYVCTTNSFDVATLTCDDEMLASTTGSVASDATAVFQIPIPRQDTSYNAYGFIVDEWGHAASGGAQGSNAAYVVSNVAPNILASQITVNGGLDMLLSVAAGQTTGFTLSYTARDNNSCEAFGGGPEITGYNVTLHRSGIATTTCDGTAGSYDPNNCYASGVATTTWNLECTRDAGTCSGSGDVDEVWNCTFPLWFLTDPTDDYTPYDSEQWIATIAAVDNNNATGSRTTSDNGVNVVSFRSFDLLSGTEIAYGSLEPGESSLTNATATIIATGNTGLNQELEGLPMCPNFNTNDICGPDPTSASSTIPENQQQFASTTFMYGSGTALSSTTPQEVDIRVLKSTSTSVLSQGVIYWAINVPSEITVAGNYSGLNYFFAASSSFTHWY